jgi:hypothetical protein
MKIYVDIYSYDFDSVYGRAYATKELAKKDECRTDEELFDFSFGLEEFPQINRFLKLCIAAQCIINECRRLGITKEDIVIYRCNFDDENVKKDLLKLIKQNYNMNFGKWM